MDAVAGLTRLTHLRLGKIYRIQHDLSQNTRAYSASSWSSRGAITPALAQAYLLCRMV